MWICSLFWSQSTSVAIKTSSVPLYVFLSHLFLSVSLSLSGANSRLSLCTSMAIVQPQSASCGLASVKLTGWLHEKKASFRNSTHCTVWTRQLLSAKDKQTDRERRQRERERKREARKTWETWKYAREQGSERAKQNLWKMQQRLVFQCVALTTCMKLECHKMLNMVIISRSHTLTHTLDVWTHSGSTSTCPITKNKRPFQHGYI